MVPKSLKYITAAPDDVYYCPTFSAMFKSVLWQRVVVQSWWQTVPYCKPTENKNSTVRLISVLWAAGCIQQMHSVMVEITRMLSSGMQTAENWYF